MKSTIEYWVPSTGAKGLVAESSRGRGIHGHTGLWEPGLLVPTRAETRDDWICQGPTSASKTGKEKSCSWWKARAICGKVALLMSVGEHCEGHLGVTPLPETIFIFRGMKQELKGH